MNVLIIDVGTSSVKAALIDRGGRLVAAATADCPAILAPQGGWSEADPEGWWRATVDAVQRLPAGIAPTAIVLTGAMQNVIALDRAGRPLRPAILYSDARIDDADLARLGPKLPDDFEARIGNRATPALCLYRIDWLMRHAPETMARCAGLLFGSKDFIVHRLTGRAVVDPTTAATTGLMDLRARQWDAEILQALGLDPSLLPPIAPADSVAGPLLPEAAVALRLPPGLPVHVGAGDAGATAWGTASEAHDRPHAYLGTTGWIAATMPVDRAKPPRDAYTLAAPVGDDVIVISPFLAAGLAIDWFAKVAGRPVADLFADAEQRDETPPRALFLPYLLGERAPFTDRAVRGAFFGLDQNDDASALAYAVLEGLAHAVRDNLDALPIRPRSIALAGGGGGARTVARLIADLTGCDVLLPRDSRFVTAFGAWRLIAPGLGFSSDTIAPRPHRAARANRRFAAYRVAAHQARALAEALRD